MNYVNCPKCNTYQPFGKGVCQICGASLEQSGEGLDIPRTPSVPIVGIEAPQQEYIPPPTMSIEDYIAQHRMEVAQEEQQEEVHHDEDPGLPAYVLVGQGVIDQIINLPWFDDECFLANPSNMNQDWAKNHYFVPIARLDELFGGVEG